MASIGLQLVGYILGLLGLLGTLIAMLLPSWRTSSYVGASIVTAGNRSNYYDAYQAQPLATRSSPRPGQAPKGKSEFNSYSLTGYV
ncbi:CLDN2 [Cervus elaphus hippelaphus]|uniref:CLDN2 n=1 Tax=Cervus elaphus hippelaphus TaxID=46360 RepID=A0A212C0V8_CEREH|nr:CLDN2 [Cervus elaphus hippelaphus]